MVEPSLPLWIEYVRALGTPLAALIGAGAATTIAYRQWRTAQNKLKFELFERRLVIYQAALDMINEDWPEEQSEWPAIAALTAKFAPARWLLNAETHGELQQLSKRMMDRMTRRRAAGVRHGEDPREGSLRRFREEKETNKLELQKLEDLFRPFLLLGH